MPTGNTQQVINYGASANDGQGDPLRTAFIKTDENFDNIWLAGPAGSNVRINNNTVSVIDTNGNLVLSPNGIGVIQTNNRLLPRLDRTYDIGAPELKYRNVYANMFVGNATLGNASSLTLDVNDLHIAGGTNGYVLQTDGNGNLTWTAQTGGGNGYAGAAGANTQIQYNNAGNFAGAAGFTFNDVSGNLSIPGRILTLVSTAANANVVGNAGITIHGANAGIIYNHNDSTWTFNKHIKIKPDSGSNIWWFGNSASNDTLVFPSGAFWTSNAVSKDDYIGSAANGYLNLETHNASGNWAARLHMEHELVHITVAGNTGANTSTQWTFNSDGTLNFPSGAHWSSNAVSRDDYITGAANGYLNLQTYNAGNLASQIHMEHEVLQLSVFAGSEQQWAFDSTGNLTLPGNILGSGNILIAPDSASSSSYLDIYLTGGPDIHIASNDNSIVIGRDTGANIFVGNDGEVSIRTDNGVTAQVWNFTDTGNLTLPGGSEISEVTNPGGFPGYALALVPDTNNAIDADQQLLIYPTGNVVADVNHLHLTSGNLYNTELFLGNDNLYVKLANTGNVVINSNDDVGNSAQWTFDTTGRVVNLEGLTLTAGGQFNICTILTGGSGYGGGGSFSATTGGSGTGLTVGYGYGLSGQVVNASVINPGDGNYQDGDVITMTAGNGAATFRLTQYNVLGNQGNNNFVESNWTFDATGGTVFPTLTIPRGDEQSGTITGQTLLFGDATQEAIISTPDGAAGINGDSSQRLVINPGEGYQGGEGGDIYLWAGRGGNASGSGGDIKIRGGQGGANTVGGAGGSGGYIRMEAGDAATTGGYPGYIDITGGYSNTVGGYVHITGGQGATVGGDVKIYGGYGTATGGNVDIWGGASGNGQANEGHVNIETGGNTWTFAADGSTTFPTGNITSDISLQLTTTFGNYRTVEYQTAGVWDVYVEDVATGPNDAWSWIDVTFKDNLINKPQVFIENQKASDGIALRWTFDENGNLTLPSNTASINYANGSPYGGSGSTYGNANVANFLANYGSNAITTTGNITAGNLIGNISITGNVQGTTANVTLVAGSYSYTFDNTGNFTMPANSDILMTGVNSVLSAGGTTLLGGYSQVGGYYSTLGVKYAGAGTQFGMTLQPTADNTTAIQFLNAAGNSIGNIKQTSSTVKFVGDGSELTGVATQVTGSWTVPVGNSTQSFTVSPSETYYMWVDCNIPNGILVWNATATITNTNVPVVGAQYAWVYTGGGTPIDFTSIPNQFVGTSNTIVRSSVAPSATTNRFDFGINNTSGGNVTVRYGWTAIS